MGSTVYGGLKGYGGYGGCKGFGGLRYYSAGGKPSKDEIEERILNILRAYEKIPDANKVPFPSLSPLPFYS